MTADFRTRYNKMLEEKNRGESAIDRITRILYGGGNK